MSEPPEKIAALLAQIRQGDENALAQLVRHYEPELRIAAHVRLGPALRPYLDSMDLVQSVHRSLIGGLRQNKFDFSSPDKLLALAVTLVQRKIARHWRRVKREAGASRASDTREVLLSLCSPQADPASAAEIADAADHFLSGLDDVDRRLLELRLEGCSTAEAARQLGVDAGFLRARLGRLRKRLVERGLLSDWL
jgi:RNA polymerase sigma-70 factor (ECF subfamily)